MASEQTLSLEQAATLKSGATRYTTMRSRLGAILAGSLGNLVEWYDFYAYAAFALYFAHQFFPSSDPLIQQINAAVLFALGFVVRPIGGWVFGHFADAYGRRNALTVSVVMMCGGSLLIAVTPTFGSVGYLAPVMLAVARVIQGLSLGGEYGASATYLMEISDKRHRGFYGSFQYVTLIGGQLSAILVLLVLQKLFLTNDQLRDWGWRIPFIIGAALAVVAAYMRRNMHETQHFQKKDKPSPFAIFRYPRQVLLVVGITVGGTSAFYTFTVYMQKYLKLSVGLTDDQTTMVTAGALLFAMLLQPVYGALSDRIGRKPLLIFFGAAGVVFTLPIMTMLQSTRSAVTAFFLVVAAWVIMSAYTAISGVVKAELFPANVRATGVGLPYALTISVFGGTIETIALWLKSIGHENYFFYYLTACIGVSLLVYLFMRDTREASAIG